MCKYLTFSLCFFIIPTLYLLVTTTAFGGFGGILLKILGPVRKFKLLCLVTCLDYV